MVALNGRRGDPRAGSSAGAGRGYAGCACAPDGASIGSRALPGSRGEALDPLVDHLADGRRPLRARARDRVRRRPRPSAGSRGFVQPVRPSHVNGVILAWLTMMYFGALFYMLPRLVGTRGMWSERLGVICAWAWNLMYLLGIIGLLTGHSQGREYARVHLADRHRAARHLVRQHRQHPGDGLDPDDQADLRLRLVLHREPALARGRLRDRERDLATRARLGRPSGALDRACRTRSSTGGTPTTCSGCG